MRNLQRLIGRCRDLVRLRGLVTLLGSGPIFASLICASILGWLGLPIIRDIKSSALEDDAYRMEHPADTALTCWAFGYRIVTKSLELFEFVCTLTTPVRVGRHTELSLPYAPETLTVLSQIVLS